VGLTYQATVGDGWEPIHESSDRGEPIAVACSLSR
jgi:hypothetical protein